MYTIDLENIETGERNEFLQHRYTHLSTAIYWARLYNLRGDYRVYITGGEDPARLDYDYFLVPKEIMTAEHWLEYMAHCDEECRRETIESYRAEARCHPEFWG